MKDFEVTSAFKKEKEKWEGKWERSLQF